MDGSLGLDLQMSRLRVFYQFAGWEEATLMVSSHISEKKIRSGSQSVFHPQSFPTLVPLWFLT